MVWASRRMSCVPLLPVDEYSVILVLQDEVFGSAYASAVYLSSVLKFPKDKKVYVIGMSGLEDELRSEGISFIGGTVRRASPVIRQRASHSPSQDPADNTLSAPGEIPPDPSVGAVLIGLDTSINYTKLSRAFRYLHSNPECFFLATNRDSTFPSDKGLLPGAGAILSPLVTALGSNRPVTAIGKPSTLMLDAIKAKCVQTHCLVTCTPLLACSIRQKCFG